MPHIVPQVSIVLPTAVNKGHNVLNKVPKSVENPSFEVEPEVVSIEI